MKSLAIFILFLLFINTSCSAQKRIAVLENNKIIQAGLIKYKINKSARKATVENTNNKLTNVNQLSPHLPSNVNLFNYKKINLNEIQDICANVLTISQLKEAMAVKKNASLAIRVKSNLKGDVLELEFLADENSNISIQQIEQIELKIKQQVKIYISSDAFRFVEGTNFIATDLTIWFRDLVKLQK